MKRCPQCNRIDTDEALAFCRADGTALINVILAFSGVSSGRSVTWPCRGGALLREEAHGCRCAIGHHLSFGNIDGAML